MSDWSTTRFYQWANRAGRPTNNLDAWAGFEAGYRAGGADAITNSAALVGMVPILETFVRLLNEAAEAGVAGR